MKTCSTCKFWTKTPPSFQLDGEDYRGCFKTKQYDTKIIIEAHLKPKLTANIFTLGDFGCNQHEPKD